MPAPTLKAPVSLGVSTIGPVLAGEVPLKPDLVWITTPRPLLGWASPMGVPQCLAVVRVETMMLVSVMVMRRVIRTSIEVLASGWWKGEVSGREGAAIVPSGAPCRQGTAHGSLGANGRVGALLG
jgi:hypothetical protein